MSCYPAKNVRTQDRAMCGPTDPNKYNVAEEADVVYPDGIKALADGSFHCVVCDKVIKGKFGINPHVKSKAHTEAMAKNVAETAEIVANAEQE
jgi:hypothetical protein